MTFNQFVLDRMRLWKWRREGESVWYTPTINHTISPLVGVHFVPDGTGNGMIGCTVDPHNSEYVMFYKKAHNVS
jgi:hypothetical protein